MWHPPGLSQRASQHSMQYTVSLNNAGAEMVETEDLTHSMADYTLASVAAKRGGPSQWGSNPDLPSYFEVGCICLGSVG